MLSGSNLKIKDTWAQYACRQVLQKDVALCSGKHRGAGEVDSHLPQVVPVTFQGPRIYLLFHSLVLKVPILFYPFSLNLNAATPLQSHFWLTPLETFTLAPRIVGGWGAPQGDVAFPVLGDVHLHVTLIGGREPSEGRW